MTFPQDLAETQGFTLGTATDVSISPDGARVVFLRTRGGRDRSRCLWVYDVATGTERLVVDPSMLGVESGAAMSAEERVRRERTRDSSAGISTYTTDEGVRTAAFSLAGRLWTADLVDGAIRELPAAVPAFDARPDPGGTAIAYVNSGGVRVIGIDGSGDRALVEPDGPDVTYGLAEHVAAESMARFRGFWWAPDGTRLVVARVDNSPVQTWYLTDLTEPDAEPTAMRYPPAGTANADVSLWIVGVDGSRLEVDWDRAGYEYMVAVAWDETMLSVVVQNRAQTTVRILAVDPQTGGTDVVHEDVDACWVTITPGVPARTRSGALVWTVDDGDTRRLTVGGEPVTPPGLEVREVVGVDADTVFFVASTDPRDVQLWSWNPAGLATVSDRPGYHDGSAGGTTVAVGSRSMNWSGARWEIRAAGRPPYQLASVAETAPITPVVHFTSAGERGLPTAVLYPRDHVPGTRWPVLMDPYGGPAAQRVVLAQNAYLGAQWFADQGFIVVIADGRGVPGRGPRWERLIHLDPVDMPVEDQVDALHAVAHEHPDMDLSRVGIRGWSAGGSLAARAVLLRPDVFHAAVAGAPVTDWRLYDTHWMERYHGHPDQHPEVYDAALLTTYASQLRRPLMLIHGLRDDNLHPAHTIKLSAALFAAGRPHTVLPLPTASHMSPGAVTANLFTIAARFLLDSLNPVRDIP